MSRERESGGRRWAAGLFAALATVAMAVVVSSQLSLMSVLDADRADEAAREVASSRFTAELIDAAVRSAVAPVVDDATATAVADATSQDPRVREMIRTALVTAHRQVVDPDSLLTADGDPSADTSVQAAIVDALVQAGTAAGVDLSAVAGQVEPPRVVPDQLPDVGLRPMAERSRLIAALVVLMASLAAILVHPRPGRGLAGLGWKFGIVFATWFVALVVIGAVIDTIADTLFGELLHEVWSGAVPAMLLLCGAGLLLCVGLWFGGVAVDGLTTRRTPAGATPPQEQSYWA